MNKKTIYISALCFLVSLFIACDMLGPDLGSVDSGYDKKVEVRIQIGTDGIQGRTVRPKDVLQDVSTWELQGQKQGGEETLLTEFSSIEGEIIVLEAGIWSFTLTGSKNGAVVLTGIITEQTISPSGMNTLNFTVTPVLEGEGTINLVIELPPGSGVTEARVSKDWTDLETPITPVGDKIVFTGTYGAGAYYFSIKLYKDDALYSAVSEVVYVWANLQSEKTYTLTLEDLKLTYTITYHVWEGETEAGSYRRTDAAVTLAEPPSRQDYLFKGWYDNANFSGDAVAEILAGSTGNKEFYAKWITVTPLPSDYSLAESLSWIGINVEEGGAYPITLIADETIAPVDLNYEGKKVDIILTGGTTERTISLSSIGALFTVGSGITLTLGDNVVLQGLSGNTDALVKVNSGATLVMNSGAKICGNANSSGSGGGVLVDSGTFTLNNGTISGNSTAVDGGGVYVNADGTFTMSGGDISNNSAAAYYGGGVYVTGGGTFFTMNNGTISGNSATVDGGGVYVTESSTFSMNAGNISNNSAGYGGGVYVRSGTFTMSNGNISGNSISGYGGGVHVISNSTFTMDGGEISGNSISGSDNYGGAGVFVDSSMFTMSGGDISSNTTTTSGGGVYVDNTTFTMSGGAISGNTTANYGGGVFVSSTSTFFMSNGKISGNTSYYGGGVFVDGDGTFAKESGGVIYGSNASDELKNSASSYSTGHGVYIAADKKRNTTVSTGVSLHSAQSGAEGGWVESMPGNLSLNESLEWISAGVVEGGTYTITLNADETIAPKTLFYSDKMVSITLEGVTTEQIVSLDSSGALFTVGSNVTLTLENNVVLQGLNDNTDALVRVDSGGILVMNSGSKIRGNANSSGDGGAVYVAGTFTMNSGEISDNFAPSSKGGVFVTDSGIFTMNGGNISRNTTNYGGGVYVTSSGMFTMNGGDISSNTADHGAGVHVTGSSTFTMSNGNISGNSSSGWGGGVFVYDSGTFTMSNGTISGNTAFYGGGVYVYGNGTFTKQSDGIIYGANTSDELKNFAQTNDYGHAVYVNNTQIRNRTAGKGVMLDSSLSGSADGWETPVPDNYSLAQSLEWLSANVEEGGTYTIVLNTDESLASQMLSYKGKNVTITLKGDVAWRTVSLNVNGALFIVESGVALILGNNVVLQGRTSNTAPLIRVNAGGTLRMESGSKITGNANTVSNGGGVNVNNNGAFTINGGEISGNTTANNGGGVYVASNGVFVKQSGGVVYGSNADNELKNSAQADGCGHAVYVSENETRDSTAEEGVTLDSSLSGAAGGWEGL
jgi:uncharacterized repeat protein (TIGR02543 family)